MIVKIHFCTLYNWGAYLNQPIGLVGRVFADNSRDWGSYQRHTKKVLNVTFFTLSIIRYISNGPVQRKELCPSLHLSVVAIEKGAFGSPSTMVTNFTL